MRRGVIIIIGVLLVLVVTLLIVGAVRNNGKSATNPTLTIWSPFDEQKIYNQISQDFLADHPTVKLNFKYVEAKDAKDYEAKVVNAIANGNGPDVWLVRSDWIPKHLDKSAAAISSSDDPISVLKASFISAVVDANTFNGKVYGLPMTADSLAVIYNNDLYNDRFNELDETSQKTLENPAATWDELKNQTALLSQTKGSTVNLSGLALGTAENTSVPADSLGAFLNQAGVSILSADQKDVNFNLAVYKNGTATFPATEGLDFYTSFARPGQANYSWNTSMGDPINAFLNKKTVAVVGYYSTLQTILDRKPSFAVTVAPLPQKNADAVTNRVDYGVSWSHLVNKDSANVELAWTYLGALVNQSTAYAEATKRLDVLSSSAQNVTSEKVSSDSADSIFRGQLNTIKPFYKPEWQTVDEIFQDMIKQVVNLGQSTQNSVDSAGERFKTFITP